MRVNNQILFNQIIASLAKKNSEIYLAHEKLTSLKKINRPSDDVASYTKATNYKIKVNSIEQFKRNIDIADGMLKFAERQLNDLSDTWDRVSELTVLGLNATEDSTSRLAIASELKNIANFMLGIANSKYEGNYIFSGYKSDQPPFSSIDSNYKGDSNQIIVSIDNTSYLGANVTGDKLFLFNNFPSTSLVTEEGKHIYYNSQSDGSLNIEIRDRDDTTVIKTINIKNVIDGIDKLSNAFKNNNTLEAKAIFEIVNFAKNQIIVSQTEVGAKLARLERQYEKLEETDLIYKKLLSNIQDADIAEVASEIANIQASLEALRLSASKIFSQSLLDFLR